MVRSQQDKIQSIFASMKPYCIYEDTRATCIAEAHYSPMLVTELNVV